MRIGSHLHNVLLSAKNIKVLTMKNFKSTDLNKIKQTAISFLYIKPKQDKEIPFIVHHPVFQYSEQVVDDKMFNIFQDKESYYLLLNKFADKINNFETVNSIFLLFRKQYRLTLLSYIKDDLSIQDFSTVLIESWVQTESPMQDSNVTPNEILQYFKYADKQYLMTEEELDYYNNLPEEIIIFRGVQNKEYSDGFSWTMNKEKAKWFANRFDCDGVVYKAIANKRDILCYNNRRREQEIIVDYKKLKNVTQL